MFQSVLLNLSKRILISDVDCIEQFSKFKKKNVSTIL
jgi:hypothetical protein